MTQPTKPKEQELVREKRNKDILEFVKKHSDKSYKDIEKLLKNELGIKLSYITIKAICYSLGYQKPYSNSGIIRQDSSTLVPQEREVVVKDFKKCSSCKEILPKNLFGKNVTNPDGRNYQCQECKLKISKKWRDKNREKVLKYRLTYYKKFKEDTARKKAYSKKDWYYESGVYTKNEKCVVCGKKAEAHHLFGYECFDVVWLCHKHHMKQHSYVNDLIEGAVLEERESWTNKKTSDYDKKIRKSERNKIIEIVKKLDLTYCWKSVRSGYVSCGEEVKYDLLKALENKER